MNSLRRAVLALGLFTCITVSAVAQTTSTGQASTRDFTDRAPFTTASGGSIRTIGFDGMRQGADYYSNYDHGPIVVSGITFSTTTPETFVNVTSADFYSPRGKYAHDFIVNSRNPSSNNELTITLPCSTLAIGIDFGGLGFSGSSATITLSNGHTYNQASLPVLGNTTFVGFVSSDPITSLTLNTIGDSWVLQDVVVGDCLRPDLISTRSAADGTPQADSSSCAQMPSFMQARQLNSSMISFSGNETINNSCRPSSQTVNFQSSAMPSGLLPKAIANLGYDRFVLKVDQDGNWSPLDLEFEDLTDMIGLPTNPGETASYGMGSFATPTSGRYHLALSRDGILTITDTASTNSFPSNIVYYQFAGRSNWSATETIDLNTGQISGNFDGNLGGTYRGNDLSGKSADQVVDCNVNAHTSGKYNLQLTFTFAPIPGDPQHNHFEGPTLGDIVLYPGSQGGYQHVARITGIKPGADGTTIVTEVESKWGDYGVYRHDPDDGYGTNWVVWHSRLKGDLSLRLKNGHLYTIQGHQIMTCVDSSCAQMRTLTQTEAEHEINQKCRGLLAYLIPDPTHGPSPKYDCRGYIFWYGKLAIPDTYLGSNQVETILSDYLYCKVPGGHTGGHGCQ